MLHQEVKELAYNYIAIKWKIISSRANALNSKISQNLCHDAS